LTNRGVAGGPYSRSRVGAAIARARTAPPTAARRAGPAVVGFDAVSVRTRFAPSPTGFLHMGSARTALFNWAFARRHGGAFVLRIEDTDQERSTKQAEDAILEGLRWLGLDWDEGPDVGGPHGPYFQMQRLELYRAHVEKLMKQGKAYACYCTREELDVLRKQAEAGKRQFRYPGTCRDKPYDPSRRHVIRFRMPEEGVTTFEDLVKGPISTPHDTLQDEVILRGDGVPLYNFGALVDDITMRITLVARGDDHVNNTARQILMYQALGYPLPAFAHLPMILGADKTRLSKRHGATSVMAYEEMGYLPHALVNYLARLGWSHGDQELFTRAELIEHFGLEQVGKSAGVFNSEKLTWVNFQVLKATAPAALATLVVPFLERAGLPVPADRAWLARAVATLRERAKTLVELAEMARFYLVDTVAPAPDVAAKHLKPELMPAVDDLATRLAALATWDHAHIEQAVQATLAAHGLALGKLAQPVRVAVTGGTVSPGIYEVLDVLGRERTLARLRAARAGVGAQSGTTAP